MPIENYSLNDIKTILTAFQLADKPFTMLANSAVHIYYRVVSSVLEIDLVQDTIDYLQALLANTIRPGSERRVAFIVENERGRFALIASFKLDHVKQNELFKVNKRTKRLWLTENLAFTATHLYREIELYGLVPFAHQTALHPVIERIPAQYKALLRKAPEIKPVFENSNYSGVMFTDTLLQHLFEGNVQPFIAIIDAVKEHKIACALQLDLWFSAQKDNPSVKKVFSLLSRLMHYQLLQQRCALLAHILRLDILSQEYQRTGQGVDTQTEDTWMTILIHLSLTTLTFLLQHRAEPQVLLTTLQREIDARREAIKLWESQRHLPSILPLSWYEWFLKQCSALKNYVWQRNQAYAFQVLGRFVLSEMTEEFSGLPTLSRINQHLFAMTLKIAAILSLCLPARLRPDLPMITPGSDTERNGEFGATLGLLFGVWMNYYGGLFELFFSCSLIFVSEIIHERASRMTTIRPYVPSLNNLLRLNMAFMLTIIAIYMQDDYYFKRGLSALALSELVRRLFLYFSRELELTPEEQGAFSFLFTLMGSGVGTFLYGVYHDIAASQLACEKAIAEFKHLTSTEPGIHYTHAEPSFGFNPIGFYSSCSLRLRWGTAAMTYQTDCAIEHSFSGAQGVVSCLPPKTLPRLITEQ